jgi:chemotaxis protein histidine kinase CheA
MSAMVAEVAAKLAELKASYARGLPDKIRAVEEALDRMFLDPGNPAAAQRAFRLVHTLAGTSGTYGFSLVCQASSDLKTLLRPVGCGHEQVTGALRPRVALLLDLLHHALSS